MTMATHKSLVRCLLCVGFLFQACDSYVSCRNDRGDEVDWYILYKLPKRIVDGLSYLYMDESTNGWQESTEKINSSSGTLANTLQPLFDYAKKKTEGFGYILYNDQPNKEKTVSASFGHSKGVVMLDRDSGVWLSHSTPRFPAKLELENFWPVSGDNNAQTFMCVAYSYEEFKKIGLQLQYIHAYSFDFNLPTTFHNELRCVAQRTCYPKKEPWSSVIQLISLNEKRFRSFAKYTRFGDDLYSGLMVGAVKQDLYVKSWGTMRGPLPSNCTTGTPHHVYNVNIVKVNVPGRVSFPDTVDHSKWCVTADGSWTCIADMNRETSQMKRGGGAICTDDVAVGRAFFRLIAESEQCENEGKHREL